MERRLQEARHEARQRHAGLVQGGLGRGEAQSGIGEAQPLLLVGAARRSHQGGRAVRPEIRGGVDAETGMGGRAYGPDACEIRVDEASPALGVG